MNSQTIFLLFQRFFLQSRLDSLKSFRADKRHARKVNTQNTVSAKGDEVVTFIRGDSSKETIANPRPPSHVARVLEDFVSLNRQLGPLGICRGIGHFENRNKGTAAKEVDDFH